MKLANQDQVEALDPVFGRRAAQVGRHAWSLPDLTVREKTFVFIAADLCTANLGFPLATHVRMAAANGVTRQECVAAIRHLAPYAGYPTAAVALQQLGGGREPVTGHPVPVRPVLPPDIVGDLTQLHPRFAEFAVEQTEQGWSDGALTARERSLACLATDVLHQTLDESFHLHVRLAIAAGADRPAIEAVLLLVAEYGLAKAWRAFRALAQALPL
jgi:4-carboxymuconolactone decarboxylase